MLTLALSDQWVIGLAGVQMLVNVGMAVAMFWLRNNVQRIDTLERTVKQSAEQLIESKLTGVATHLEGVINVVNERVSNIRDRLKAGDANFADLDRRDRELEARFNRRFDELKDHLHQTFATKAELHEIRNRAGR